MWMLASQFLHKACSHIFLPDLIVPTLCVGMPLVTLRVTLGGAERPGLHSHAERGNDQTIRSGIKKPRF